MNRILILFVLFSIATDYFSQESSGGVPLTFSNKTIATKVSEGVNSIILPTLNNENEKQRADSIKQNRCITCDTYYYGTGINISVDIKTQGQLEILEDGSKVWVLKIISATALGMQFYSIKLNYNEK